MVVRIPASKGRYFSLIDAPGVVAHPGVSGATV